MSGSSGLAETIRLSEAEINILRHQIHQLEAENACLRGHPASRLLALEDRLASVGPEERIEVLQTEAAAVGRGTPVAREAHAALQREVALARIHAAREAFHLRSVGTQVYHHHHRETGEPSHMVSQLGELSRVYAEEVSQIGEIQETHAKDRRGAEERERQLKFELETLNLECSHLKGRLEAYRARANEADEGFSRLDAELRHMKGLLMLAEEENAALKATMSAREAKHSEDLRSLHAKLERMSSDHGEGVASIKARLSLDHEAALRRVTAERDSLAAQLSQRMVTRAVVSRPPPSKSASTSVEVSTEDDSEGAGRSGAGGKGDEDGERSVPRTENKKKRREARAGNGKDEQVERLKETVESQLEIIRKLLAERHQYDLPHRISPAITRRQPESELEGARIIHATPPQSSSSRGHRGHLTPRLLGHGDGPCVCFTRGHANYSMPDKDELQTLLEEVAQTYNKATGEDLSASILDNGRRVRVASPSLSKREFQVAIVGGHLMAKFHGGWGALGSLIC